MGIMSDPYAPQRRDAPSMAYEPIQSKLFRKFGPRETTGDMRPIQGVVQTLSDGRPGGRPITWYTNMAPLARTEMPAQAINAAKLARAELERQVQATRFLDKERVHLMQRDKPRASDAALSLRLKPAGYGKPATPAGFVGGFTRTPERNFDHPKDTGLSMRPISTLESRWGKTPYSMPSTHSLTATFARPQTR